MIRERDKKAGKVDDGVVEKPEGRGGIERKAGGGRR